MLFQSWGTTDGIIVNWRKFSVMSQHWRDQNWGRQHTFLCTVLAVTTWRIRHLNLSVMKKGALPHSDNIAGKDTTNTCIIETPVSLTYQYLCKQSTLSLLCVGTFCRDQAWSCPSPQKIPIMMAWYLPMDKCWRNSLCSEGLPKLNC
jgi:hypothetical protein